MRPSARTLALALTAALAVCAVTKRYLPDLLSPFRHEDDARQHVWWTYACADETLFPGDLAKDYFRAPTFAPAGYRALACAGARVLDAQVFSEIVPFFLSAAVAALAIAIGLCVSGGSWLGAAAAAVFALQGGVLSRVEGGLPRSWAMPVLLLGVWAALSRRHAILGVAFLLVALFYPPLIVNLGLFGGAAWLSDLVARRRIPRGTTAMLVLGAASLAIVVLAYRAPSPDPMGPKVTEAVARTMPEFWPGGRSAFFADDPVAYFVTNVRSGLGYEPWKLLVIVAAVTASAWILRGAIPRTLWLLPATALLGFFAAHATLFALHLPSRYTRFALPAFFLAFVAAAVPAAVARMRRHPRAAQILDAAANPRVLVPLLSVWVAAAATDAAFRVTREVQSAPPDGYSEVVRFVSTLPRETLIAAHPTDASDLPLLTRRSVLACEETSTPYDLRYYGEMKRRIGDMLAACYASDWEAVDALSAHGVDVFLVDRDRYRRPVDPARVYYEPFRSAVAPLVARGDARGFVLENPPDDRVLHRSGRYLVVRVKEP